MQFRNHLIVGVAVLIVSNTFNSVISLDTPLLVFAFFFGVILPDIDHPESKLGRRVRFISVPIAMIFGHRQITHSLWMFALWVAGDYYNIEALKAMFIGVLAHLIADMLTGSVPLLYPIKSNVGCDITLGNSKLETLIAFMLLCLALTYHFNLFYFFNAI